MAKAETTAMTTGGFNLVTMYDGMDEELKAELQEEMSEVETGGSIDCRRITVGANTKVFKVESDTDGDPDYLKEVRGVVLFTHLSNCKWVGDYQEGAVNMPECASLDGKQGVIFETGVIRDCDQCDNNRFTPDETGKTRKACRNTRRIYMILEGKPQLYLLQVPPTSLKSVRDCMKKIMSGGLPFSRQVVSFKINDAFRITVEKGQPLTPEQCELAAVMRRQVKEQYESATVQTDAYFASDEDAMQEGRAVEDASGWRTPPAQAADEDGFINMPEGTQEELPFN